MNRRIILASTSPRRKELLDKAGTSFEAVETKVYFKNLTDQEIDDYIATGEPLERAGAYAIQDTGQTFVDRIEGDYDNVI